jgi:hypothetical protein
MRALKVKVQTRYLPLRILFRFMAGRDLDGQRRTNATMFRHADKDLTEHQRAGRWAHRMHVQRSGVRVACLLYFIAAIYGWFNAHILTEYLTSITLACLLGYGIWLIIRKIIYWPHHHRLVIPLFRTVAPILGHSPGDHHSKYIRVPRDMAKNEKAKIKVMLNPFWEGTVAHQKAITALMSRRFNLDLEGMWHFHAWPPYAEFMRAPSPPGKVTFAEFKTFMDKSQAHIIPMGLGSNRQLISLNLDDEAPHVALSVGTGGGKTTMMTLVISFLVHNGVERIDVINTKQAGYKWCENLPGVFVHYTMAAQMEAIRNFRMRMSDRYDQVRNDDNLTFPRQVLIIEEQNSWMKMAKKFWDDYRQELEPKERNRVPRKNPAVDDIAYCLFMGRQACMNVISIFQRMSASAAGDGDMRDQYGARILARSRPASWKILVGTTPVPKDSMSVIRGRAVFVLGDEAHPIQIAYLTTDEGYAYAMSGMPSLNMPDGSGGTPAVNPAAEMYSLREIADNVIPISYAALRKAKSRDKRFPQPISNSLYSKQDIESWYKNRPSTIRKAA